MPGNFFTKINPRNWGLDGMGWLGIYVSAVSIFLLIDPFGAMKKAGEEVPDFVLGIVFAVGVFITINSKRQQKKEKQKSLDDKKNL